MRGTTIDVNIRLTSVNIEIDAATGAISGEDGSGSGAARTAVGAASTIASIAIAAVGKLIFPERQGRVGKFRIMFFIDDVWELLISVSFSSRRIGRQRGGHDRRKARLVNQ